MIRKSVAAALSVLLLTGLAGCAADLGTGMIKELEDNKEGIRQEFYELWNAFLEESNEWSESFATHSVTGDHDLAGKRETEIDSYVGMYEADYSEFDGTEYIFGGTSLKRQAGRDLCAAYSLTVQSGQARLYRMDGSDEILLADISKEGTYKFTIHAGKNFIVLDGTQFTGSLTLTVESATVESETSEAATAGSAAVEAQQRNPKMRKNKTVRRTCLYRTWASAADQ